MNTVNLEVNAEIPKMISDLKHGDAFTTFEHSGLVFMKSDQESLPFKDAQCMCILGYDQGCITNLVQTTLVYPATIEAKS